MDFREPDDLYRTTDVSDVTGFCALHRLALVATAALAKLPRPVMLGATLVIVVGQVAALSFIARSLP